MFSKHPHLNINIGFEKIFWTFFSSIFLFRSVIYPKINNIVDSSIKVNIRFQNPELKEDFYKNI